MVQSILHAPGVDGAKEEKNVVTIVMYWLFMSITVRLKILVV